ncbi:hypothetical protein [Streptomyces malaysiensis]|uniref:hypothetical protein n=1 Tax=Streptomyces malaysiensis TaxID=92644 RepID=UPI002B2C751A|nr:hypothetical protein R8789_13580 [Streptomyces malaysiensis]
MDSAAVLFILAVAGVVSIFLFALKGLLDQVPDVIDFARHARDAWRRFKEPETPHDEQPPPADDEEGPPSRRPATTRSSSSSPTRTTPRAGSSRDQYA